MSNRILAYTITIALIVGTGGFAVWRIGQNKKQEQPNYQTPESRPIAAVDSPAPVPVESVEEEGACERKFDSEKAKTAKVDIKGRRVAITVKNFGNIIVEFFDSAAPRTVENFLRLVNAGFYDCLTFHRVAKGFVIQGGDPTGTGRGGESAFGGEFADEIDSNSSLYRGGYKKGYVAMANRGPNTNTSQFFILLADSPLPPNYTIFGRVVEGMAVVEQIGQVEITPQLGPTDGQPKVPVVMEAVKIIQ